MYGCLNTPWYQSRYPHDPRRPWSWEVIWRNSFHGCRRTASGIAKTRGACNDEIEVLLRENDETPLATRIWCNSNTL